jgi:hypothetical protein
MEAIGMYEKDRKGSHTIKKESITFSRLFEFYLEQQKADGKKTWKREQELYKGWIQPVIGNVRLLDIAPIHLERIKSNMSKKELSPRTIHYCL